MISFDFASTASSICLMYLSVIFCTLSSSSFAWSSFKSPALFCFLTKSFASRRIFLTATFASSPRFLTSFASSFLRSSVSVSICAMISALSYIIAFLQVIICPCLFTNLNLNSFRFWFCHDKSRPNKKENTSWISFKKCSLYSKYCIVFYPYNNSFCFTILQNYMKNCCQFVVNSDLRCRNPLILLVFLVQRLHCGDSDRNPELSGIIKNSDVRILV